MQHSNVNVVAITDERGRQYGDFATQGEIAQDLKQYLREQEGWGRMKPHQREALDMIMHKIARIVNGNPNHKDSWVDIGGYAHIVAIRILDGD